jgi:hypothetical protein
MNVNVSEEIVLIESSAGLWVIWPVSPRGKNRKYILVLASQKQENEKDSKMYLLLFFYDQETETKIMVNPWLCS